MADVMSILSASYKSVGLVVPSKTPYVAVDPKNYQGTWSGKYADNKMFKITVSDVSGFRAKVKYQSGTTVKYGDVLIKDKSFRIGDTKFTLAKAATANKAATATIKNVITDPATGSTYLDTATATQS
jgi:multidrug resistance efflux pump